MGTCYWRLFFNCYHLNIRYILMDLSIHSLPVIWLVRLALEKLKNHLPVCLSRYYSEGYFLKPFPCMPEVGLLTRYFTTNRCWLIYNFDCIFRG